MLRQKAVWLFDIFVREPKMIWTHYRPFSPRGKSHTARNIFMADGRTTHGGMFDRLKGLISVYAVSKAQGKEFKINFTSPFDLTKYLEPNNYDWRIGVEDITYSYSASRPLFLYGECYNPRRLLKNRKHEAHFYYGNDSLEVINKRYNCEFDWGGLYHELFRPTAYLQQYIDTYKQELSGNYIAVHTRFLNLLGDKVETTINPTLPEEQQVELKEKIYRKIKEIAAARVGRGIVLLASDSTSFIQYMQQQDLDVYVIPGDIKHIDTAQSTNDGDVVKMFLDYYMLANAQKVYNIVGEGMWPSAFPEYAAKIGGAEFQRVKV